MSREHSAADPLGPLADEFVQRFRHGERPSLSEYTSRYRELSERICELFPLLVMMEQAGSGVASLTGATDRVPEPRLAAAPVPERIGGYRIVREIGRGGMGVVYEAEQIALGRHVALKVLPSSKTRDDLGLQRFRREARVAARLHHTNIVPVFEVGDDRETCFYAMQFIHGQSLDQVLDELRQLRNLAQKTTEDHRSQVDLQTRGPESIGWDVARSLMSGFSPELTHKNEFHKASPPPDDTSKATTPVLLPGQEDHSQVSTNKLHYYRSVARVGIQVAEALKYAHSEGVLHRDIKPANLLLDTHSRVWITDFGLAKTEEMALTQDGDIIGTIRYMAPERFEGKADARSDVYSLGLTLYEMLVLCPAFESPDRLALVHQVTRQQPPRLRQFDPQIPRDLATIVNKSIEKEPARRYQNATDLSADLQRFLEHKPIHARPTSFLEHGWRWCQRNPTIATLAACVLLVAVAGFLGVVYQWQVASANERQANANAERAKKSEKKARSKENLAKLNEDQIRKQEEKTRKANKKLNEVVARMRRATYNTHMNLAKHAWDAGSIARVQELLDSQLNEPNVRNLRAFEWYLLRHACKGNRFTFTDHNLPVVSVAYSPNGKQMASLERQVYGSIIIIRDAKTGKTLRVQGVHGGVKAHSIVYSPDGNYLATAIDDGTIKIWETSELRPTSGGRYGRPGKTPKHRLLKSPGEKIHGVRFSPDGKRLASISGERDKPGDLKLWDLKTGRVLFRQAGYVGYPRCLAFSKDGKLLAAAYKTRFVRLLDARDGAEIRKFEATKFSIVGLAIHPDGKQIAVAGISRSVPVFDLRTGKEVARVRRHLDSVISVAYSDDGRFLATGSRMVNLWDAKTHKHLCAYKGHQLEVVDMEFSPGGEQLATASGDTTVRVWNTDRGTEPLSFHAHRTVPVAVTFSADGKSLATSARDNTMCLWDAATGVRTHKLQFGRAYSRFVLLSSDGQWLAGGAPWNQPMALWNLKTKKAQVLPGQRHGVYSAAFSPDSKHIAVALPSKVFQLWEIVKDKAQFSCQWQAGEAAVYHIAYSPDGKLLASCGSDNCIRFWDAETTLPMHTISCEDTRMQQFAFSPKGRYIVAASLYSPLIRMWEVAGGKHVRTFKGHTSGVFQVVFSPTGKRMASAGADGTIKMWDVETAQETLTLSIGRNEPTAIAFDVTGQRLASTWNDGFVRVWDAPR